jgi:NAD(P)-dependent dehydrogenase (short-subunit alcohol dehydrogenase family)
MNEFQLNGKTILITGASSGIGKEAALLLSEYGASVIITGRDKERLEETFQQLSPHPLSLRAERSNLHSSCPADLTVEAEMDALIADLPPLNGIVHCAGIVGPLPSKFITREEIDKMFSINYNVPVNLTSKILRKKKLLDNASLVFMSTIATKNPYFGGALYSSSKAALEAYSKTLALELMPRGIRSNCLLAGLVDTPMIVSPAEKGMQEEALGRYLQRYPLGIGSPKDVAATILFFLSDASKWITGTNLILGGE